jgi:hypothetical protein
MTNKYTGAVSVDFGKVKGELVYDWNALATVKTEFKDEQIATLYSATPKQIARLLEIGFQKKNPEITADLIMEESPPMLQLAGLIDKAILYAHWGAEEAEKMIKEDDDRRKEIADAFKKKTQ